MVYTITLNPALDRTLWLEKIQPDESNRIEKEQRYAGGKRIDVSKVLTTIGMSNRTLGFVGSFAGEELEGRCSMRELVVILSEFQVKPVPTSSSMI